jgi:hypothetical protein
MFKCVWLLLLVSPLALGQASLSADEIMTKVAANQDRAVELRAHYVYKQHTHATSHKTNGKLMREETDDYDIFPTAKGFDHKLQTLTGRYWHKGKYVDFKGEPIPDEDSIDAELTHEIMHDQEEESRDGVFSHLFPLTSKNQKEYEFRLMGEETYQGRPAYHIGFDPKDKKDVNWTGEAYIDKAEFQPIHVFTKMNHKLPLFVRGVLGVDLPGVGFNVQYIRVEEGVWFPQTFGSEFELHLFHMFSRSIAISLKNSDFQKTHVDTKIEVAPPGQETPAHP